MFYAKAIFFLLLFLPAGIVNAQSITWGEEINVAMGSMYGNVRPRIAITSDNIPVIMWGGGSGSEPLYTARWNGSGFSAPVQITPAGADPFIDTWAGPDIAANGNALYVAFKRQPEMMNYIYIVKSADGGLTWSDTIRVPSGTGAYARFPAVAVTASGDPAVMFMTFNSSWGNAQYAVSNSIDGGQTFLTPVNVSAAAGPEVCDCCPGYLEIQGSNQVAAFRRNNNNMRDIWTNASANGGASFTSAMDVDNTNWMINACPSTGPDPYLWSDSLFTVFMSASSGDSRIYINTRNITTQQNGFTARITPNLGSAATQNYPFIAGSSDTLAVVWQQNEDGNVDSYFSWSLNGAAGLIRNEVRLNNNAMGVQQNPHVAYSNGTFHFVFADEMTGNVIYKKGTVDPTGINKLQYDRAISVAPNPFSDKAILKFSNPGKALVHAGVYDVSGKMCKSYSTSGEFLDIEKGALEAGVYFIRLSAETGILGTVKLIIVEL